MTVSAGDPVLCDTNILLYAFDADEPQKRPVAAKLVESLIMSGRLILTAQLLNEFVWNATRPASKNKAARLDMKTTAEVVTRWCAAVPILPLTKELTLRAMEAMPRHGLAFWGALIWAAAKENGVGLIYTEDFQHGRDVEGVRFENPFVARPQP